MVSIDIENWGYTIFSRTNIMMWTIINDCKFEEFYNQIITSVLTNYQIMKKHQQWIIFAQVSCLIPNLFCFKVSLFFNIHLLLIVSSIFMYLCNLISTSLFSKFFTPVFLSLISLERNSHHIAQKWFEPHAIIFILLIAPDHHFHFNWSISI